MEKLFYTDSLVKITNNYILLRKYYFTTFTSQKINFSDIAYVELAKPSLMTGKFRIWGTGDFKHWFPLDLHRTKRDVIFIIHRRHHNLLVGFTAVDSKAVKSILEGNNLLKI